MPICAESSYIIQCMEEFCEITVDVTQSIWRSKLDVDRLIDRGDDLRSAFDDNYRSWRPTVGVNDRLDVSMYGMLESDRQISDQVTAITDKIVDAYRKYNGKTDPLGMSKDFELFVPTEEALGKESNVRYILERDNNPAWLSMLNRQYNDFMEDYHTTTMRSFSEWQEARKTQRVDDMHIQIGELESYISTCEQSRTEKIAHHKDIKRGQKILKKSIKTFTNLFGSEDINAFITGNGFTIEGDLYNYRVSKKQDIIYTSYKTGSAHVPYRLQLLSKENIVLADGCIYFKNTPVIDQLIAMMLHIKNGNEREILKNTNFSNITDAYVNDQLLADIKEERKRESALLNGGGLNLGDSPYFAQFHDYNNDIAMFRPIIRPVVERVLIDMLDIPEPAAKFMIHPSFRCDDIQFMSPERLEQHVTGRTEICVDGTFLIGANP